MPLFGTPKKPLQKKGVGQAIEKLWRDNKPVYHLPITNEVFEDYEEYVNRAIMYKLQIWSCQYTGKDSMTYEQALEYEKEHKHRDLFRMYPRFVLRHICYMVHNSLKGETVQELAHRIAKFFEYNFVEGEELFCELDNTISVVLRRILLKKLPYYVSDRSFPPFSTPLYITDADQNQIEVFHQTKDQEHYYDYDLPNMGFGTQSKLYEVEITSPNSPFDNKIIVVYYNVLLRKQSSLIENVEKLTRWLFDNTYVDADENYILLKSNLVEYFKFEPRVPTQVEYKSKFQIMIDEEMEDIEKFKRGTVKSLNDLKYHHIDRLGRIMTDIREIEETLGLSDLQSITQTPKHIASQPMVATNGVIEPIVPQTQAFLLPKKDGTILDEYLTNRDKSKMDSEFPKPHYDYILKYPESIPAALHVFSFLNVFQDILPIVPFTFDEFQYALECKDPENPLLKSILSTLLLFLLFEKGANKNEINRSIYRMKKLYNEVKKKDHRFINVSARKHVVNRDAVIHIAQTIPTLVLREYWRVYLRDRLEVPVSQNKDIPEVIQEATTNGENASNTEVVEIADETMKDEKAQETVQETVKQETTNETKDVKENEKAPITEEVKPEKRNAYQLALKFIKDDNYNNENEIEFFKDLESDVKIAILDVLTEACISTTNIREHIEQNIERKRVLKRQRNLEQLEDAEKAKVAEENITSEDLKNRRRNRERNYQLLVNQCVTRARCLGFDRFYNRYWLLPAFTGVLFVEPCNPNRSIDEKQDQEVTEPSNSWGYYRTKEEFKQLLAVLDPRGFREKKLLAGLRKNEDEILRQISIRGSVLLKEEVTAASEHPVGVENGHSTTENLDVDQSEQDTKMEDVSNADAVSTESSSSKKRKQAPSDDESSTKKTKREESLDEQAKKIREFVPQPSAFSPDSFKHYKNTLAEVVSEASECFIDYESDEEEE